MCLALLGYEHRIANSSPSDCGKVSPDKRLPGNDSNPAPFKPESNLRLGTAEAGVIEAM